MEQSELRSILLVNALRLMDDYNRAGLCIDIIERLGDKEQLNRIEKILNVQNQNAKRSNDENAKYEKRRSNRNT